MHRLTVGVLLVGLVGAGCFAPAEPAEAEAKGAMGLGALHAIRAWVDNATTTEPDKGLRWADGRWHTPDGSVVHETNQPVYVASLPFPTQLDAIDGAADWKGVHEMLHSSQPLVHPDYTELAFHANTGKFFPDWYDDGSADGAAKFWESDWQVEWQTGRQDGWEVEWKARPFGNTTSWGLRGFTTGDQEGVCSDEAVRPPVVDSGQAFSIALAQERFAAVRTAHPSGELWVTLTLQETPRWELGPEGVTFVCSGPTDPSWRVRWMDLDETVAGGAPYVDVVVDAFDGEVTNVHRSFLRPPGDYVWHTALSEVDPMPGNPAASSWSFDVPEDQVRLLVHVTPVEPVLIGLQAGDENDYQLVAPDGRIDPIWRGASTWSVDVVHPLAGTWTVERTAVDGADTTHFLRNITAQVVG